MPNEEGTNGFDDELEQDGDESVQPDAPVDSAEPPVEGTPADADADADSAEAHPGELSPAEQRALLTALLFTSGERVELERLQSFFGLESGNLRLLAEETAGELRAIGLDIMDAAGGLKLVSAAQWDGFLSRYHRQVRKARLGKSSLEILAIIAYEQPVSRARVDELRQVNSESSVRALLDRRLITVAGRAETPGRPFLYKTTDYFLEVFGLASLADLPPRPADLHSRLPGSSDAEITDPDDDEGILHIHGEVDE